MNRLRVDLKESSYEIIVGKNILSELGKLITEVGDFSKIAIITDNNVGNLYLDAVRGSLLKKGFSVCDIEISDGEGVKGWKYAEKLVEWILENKLDREGLVIALGGGVLGDLVGFSASIARRGLALIQIPTTLLAQVDSSVGGKTAINSKFGKNLIGTFFQPKLVVSDVLTLSSLSGRHFLSGMSEVIKYGLIRDPVFFNWIEENLSKIKSGNPEIISELVIWSCSIKKQFVQKDEREMGERALLNLGHTFGHALETYTGYSNKIFHGEAVSIGTTIAFQFSHFLGMCSISDVNRLIHLYAKLGMKHQIKDISMTLPSPKVLIKFMLQDKKVKNGNITYILPKKIGKCIVSENCSIESVNEFLNTICP